jgi:hypothetical protein
VVDGVVSQVTKLVAVLRRLSITIHELLCLVATVVFWMYARLNFLESTLICWCNKSVRQELLQLRKMASDFPTQPLKHFVNGLHKREHQIVHMHLQVIRSCEASD